MKVKFVFAAIFLLLGQDLLAQTAGAPNNWSTRDRLDFIEECITSASEQMSMDSASSYCNCMLPKVEAGYPRVEEVEQLTDEVLATPEWQKKIQDCMQGWTGKDRDDFINECVNTASESLGRDKAVFYCNCMLIKVETWYPLINDAGKLTEADFQTPEFQKLIRDCMGGWSQGERLAFSNACLDEAGKTMNNQQAKRFCNCAIQKIEYRLPVYTDAQYLIPGKLNTPYWQQVLLRCY